MTHPHPRDPRLQRRRDPLAAAVRLEVAADAMRAHQLDRGLDEQLEPAPVLTTWHQLDESTEITAQLAADVVTAVQLGTVEPPITAAEFAAALGPIDPEPARHQPCVCGAGVEVGAPGNEYRTELGGMSHGSTPCYVVEPLELPESPAPPPVAPVIPAAPAPVDYVPPMAPIVERLDYRLRGDNPEADRRDDEEFAARAVFSSEHRRPTWRSRHDPESLRYGVRPRLGGVSAPLENVLLPIGPVLDQGAEGECVTYAITAALNVLELVDADLDDELLGADTARELYPIAQRLDERPGEDYLGTSILGGLQAALEARLIGGYLWAFGTRDVAQNVLRRRRPVVVGVSWLSGMYDTGPGGLVELTGDDQGLGHALAVVGLKLKGPQGQPGPYFIWQNSWGTSYGDGGLGYVHHRDLALLLRGRGEAGIPTREVQVPTP